MPVCLDPTLSAPTVNATTECYRMRPVPRFPQRRPALVSRVNDLPNPVFMTASAAPDPRFARFVELVSQLAQSEALADRIVIPVSTGIGGGGREGIVFRMRSVCDLVELLSAALEIPEEDIAAGTAIRYPNAGSLGSRLRVRRARNKPDNAYVLVKHHNWWYYISETDQATKRFFHLVTVLWSVTIAESTAGSQKAPLLMLPASR
jgi:hypothetical protein